jgi:hypothetical protein
MAFSLFKSLCRGRQCTRKRIDRKRINEISGIRHYSEEDPEYKDISKYIFDESEMLSNKVCRNKVVDTYIKETLSGKYNEPPVITIMKSEDSIKGFALFSIENRVLYIHVICAKKGSGIGRQIITSIEEYGKDNNVRSIEIDSIFTSVRFYKKLGYTVHKNSDNYTLAFNESNYINSNYNNTEFDPTKMTKKLRGGRRLTRKKLKR